jgi:hypothetical protein
VNLNEHEQHERLSNVLYRRLWCMWTQCIFESIYESVAPSVIFSALVLSFALRSHRPAFIDESASCWGIC